jgi:hypothetical protein
MTEEEVRALAKVSAKLVAEQLAIRDKQIHALVLRVVNLEEKLAKATGERKAATVTRPQSDFETELRKGMRL